MLYPMKLDLARDRVLRIEMSEAAFRAASFLDDRILDADTRGGWVSLPELQAQSALLGGSSPLHFIFHTGHVGSTLVSRLLDETGKVLSLREPLPLRTLATAQDAIRDGAASAMAQRQLDALMALFVRLWRRSFDSTQSVIVKATSSCARLAPALLAAVPQARAIYLNLGAEAWLATLLAGENSHIDLHGHAAERMSRLAADVQEPLPAPESLSPGELAALGWLTETSTQLRLLSEYPGRVLPIDFDAFLRNPSGQLRAILAHFQLPHDPVLLDGIVRSPVLTRYSKAPEHPYDPGLRAAVLQDSRLRHRDEIARGLRVLERLIGNEPRLTSLFGVRPMA